MTHDYLRLYLLLAIAGVVLLALLLLVGVGLWREAYLIRTGKQSVVTWGKSAMRPYTSRGR